MSGKRRWPWSREEPARAAPAPSLEPVRSKAGDISFVLDNNQMWAERKKQDDPEFFARQASGQSPSFLWVGCADSRVPANRILGLDVGEVFVHRNVANQALGNDISCMAVIQYAVDVLKVPHIIVCGHYDCGGVRAAMEKKDHGSPLENWLRNIRDVYRLHRPELDAIADDEERTRRLVELNVIEQCLNIFKTGVVQRQRMRTFVDPDVPFTQPRVHAMVYSPADGSLKKLKVDWSELVDDLGGIYDLVGGEQAAEFATAAPSGKVLPMQFVDLEAEE